MAAIHATGLWVPNRSHFSAMETVEDAAPGSNLRSGWLNRLLGTDKIVNPVAGVQYGAAVPSTQLAGPRKVLAVGARTDVTLAPGRATPAWRRRKALEAMWGETPGKHGQAVRDAFDAVDMFRPVLQPQRRPAGAPKPRYDQMSDLSRALEDAARTIRAGVGAKVITVDQGSWDHHVNLGTVDAGVFADMTDDFARSLAAFFTDLGTLATRVTVVTISEFGRRVAENSSAGLDHGHGNVMFVLGAGVKGGYYAQWPGLENTADADLRVTTDYRDVLSEVIAARFPEVSLPSVFPSFDPRRVGFMERRA